MREVVELDNRLSDDQAQQQRERAERHHDKRQTLHELHAVDSRHARLQRLHAIHERQKRVEHLVDAAGHLDGENSARFYSSVLRR